MSPKEIIIKYDRVVAPIVRTAILLGAIIAFAFHEYDRTCVYLLMYLVLKPEGKAGGE